MPAIKVGTARIAAHAASFFMSRRTPRASGAGGPDGRPRSPGREGRTSAGSFAQRFVRLVEADPDEPAGVLQDVAHRVEGDVGDPAPPGVGDGVDDGTHRRGRLLIRRTRWRVVSAASGM